MKRQGLLPGDMQACSLFNICCSRLDQASQGILQVWYQLLRSGLRTPVQRWPLAYPMLRPVTAPQSSDTSSISISA